ncbi:hypothetical protein [Cohnella kolymensis]|uniref:hypothetical protein n=1 Tax=Cohnella kolymensis TaxID=1590652 RepID=UPI000A70C015|nr:hypothetical protein [Cohnella kolymensis]
MAELESKKKSDSHHSYFVEHAALLRYRLIQNFDDSDIAAEFLAKNLKYPEFRRVAISDALAEQRYEEALQLTEEGERLDTRNGFPGLVNEWKKLRYEVYRLTYRIDMQRQLAEELALDGEYSYYQSLQELYDTQEWPAVRDRILTELEKGGRGWHAHDLYTNLLIEEKETARLLRYVQKHHRSVSEYYPHLVLIFLTRYMPFLNSLWKRRRLTHLIARNIKKSAK